MADSETTAPETTANIIRLPGIELDRQGHRLLVDGRQRACSQRAMALLALLCQRPGRVWTRGELLDALWPGGQVVADESLSQLVFRLRAALGPRGDCIVTVRGVGVRLDLAATPPAPAPADPGPARTASEKSDPEPPSPARDPSATMSETAPVAAIAPRRRPRLATVVLAAALIGLAGWLLGRQFVAPVPVGLWIDVGMGVQAYDLGSAPEQARALVTEAFAQDREGDRARARALMEAAHENAPDSPLPALILALWTSSIGDGSQAREWLDRAGARDRQGSAYLLLLENYIRAELGSAPLETVRHAGALLDLRPQAWFLRLARAHLYGARGLRDRALEELRGIVADDLRHPRLAMAVADRAAYGDVAGARSLLAGLDEREDTPDLALARARVEWSAGNLDAARVRLAATAQLAHSRARLDIRDRALAYAGLLDLLDGRPEAGLPLLERARAGARDRRATGLELDLTLVIAHAHAAQGRDADLRVEMAHAVLLSRAQSSGHMVHFTRLVALRLAPDLEATDLSGSDEPGAASLLAARRALGSGDRNQARSLAERAVAQGSLEARLAEETRLLLAELDMAVPEGPPLHPPHPPLTRFVIRQLADARAATRPPD